MPPVNTMVECPQIEKDGHYKTFGEVMEKFVDVIGMYNDCRARHNALVEFERKK